MTFFNIVSRTIFWLTTALIITTAFALTIGQELPIEFSNNITRNMYYYYIFLAVPISILLTLTRTIKKKHTKLKNWTIGILTVLSAGLCAFFILVVAYEATYGRWTDNIILYRGKSDKNVTIKYQFYDQDSYFDHSPRRTVMITPFLKWFQKVEEIDTSKIDKTKWLLVNEKRDSLTYRQRARRATGIVQ